MQIVDFEWNRPQNVIIESVTGGDRGLLFLANEAKRLMDPYVPADSLVLAQNVNVYVDNGKQGIVHYLSPYAHYQYKGELYVDPGTGAGGFYIEGVGWRSRSGVAKKPSGKKLKHGTFRHPLATSEWDKAMMAARRGDLTKAYQNYIGSK